MRGIQPDLAPGRASIVVIVGALCTAGCEPQDLPGERVGIYAIEGVLLENTCGSTALPAPDPLVFDVELRDQSGVGIWILNQPPGVTGRLSDDGTFQFEYGSEYTAIEPGGSASTEPRNVAEFLAFESQPSAPTPGCRLRIQENISGRAIATSRPPAGGDAGQLPTSDPGTTGADLSAINRIEIVPMAGSDCRPALAVQGGPFHDLPCQAQYRLTGTLSD